MAKVSRAVVQPNLGLYFDRPSIAIPARGLRDGNNFRIIDGEITNLGLGCTAFNDIQLNGPVKLIQNFIPRAGSEQLVFCTLTDVYRWNGTVLTFLTPIYHTGTVTVAATAVTGAGTSWLANAAVGDQISFGAADEDDPAATWYTILHVNSDTTIDLTTSAGVIGAGALYTIRKLFQSTYEDHWDSEIFVGTAGGSDYLVLTNGVDDIMSWDGAAAQLTNRSALGFKCHHLKMFSNMMIYLNLIQGGNDLAADVINSDVGDPFNVTTGLSEQFQVHDKTNSPILDADTLGDNLVIYSRYRITLVQFLGDPLIFAFRQIGNNIGPIGQRLTANFGDYHEFMGDDSQYKFDGAALSAINTQAFKAILRDRDPERETVGFSFFDPARGDLVWIIPLTSDPGAGGSSNTGPATGWGEHYLEEVGPNTPTPISKRDFVFTAAGEYTNNTAITWADLTGLTWADLSFRWNEQSFFTAFPAIIVGDVNGRVCSYATSNTADGEILPFYVTFPRRPTGDGRMRALISRVYPFATSVSDPNLPLGVSLLLSDSAEGEEAESDVETVLLPTLEGQYFVSPFRRARFVSVKFSQDDGLALAFSGYDMDIRGGGYR